MIEVVVIDRFHCIGIPIIKLRWSSDRLRFRMGIRMTVRRRLSSQFVRVRSAQIAADILIYEIIFLNENCYILIQMSSKLFTGYRLTMGQHCLRKWLGAEQNIIWTNDGLIYWRMYTSLGLDELNTITQSHTQELRHCGSGRIIRDGIHAFSLSFANRYDHIGIKNTHKCWNADGFHHIALHGGKLPEIFWHKCRSSLYIL